MANPSVTYTFTNATTADGTQVSQNFTDLINGMTDGTKTFSIDALTCAGAAIFNGATTLGNATGDTITIGGYISGSIIGSTTAGVPWAGKTDGNAPASGMVGEYVASNSPTPASLTTGQYSDGGSTGILLTAGIWDIQAIARFALGATTKISYVNCSIGTASGNSATGTSVPSTVETSFPLAAPADKSITLATALRRVNIATGSTVTYYPKAYATFDTSTATAACYLTARLVA